MTTHIHTLPHTELNSNTNNTHISSLRAAVLGANDGIVSVASVIVGVAGASSNTMFIITSGVAALFAGALSMAVGEYVSVSAERDTQKALLAKERYELENHPEAELEELALIYQKKGLSKETAHTVAAELTKHDAFLAHVEAELGIDLEALSNPYHAAIASFFAFVVGALIPVVVVAFAPSVFRIQATFIAVLVALLITGALSAKVGGAHKGRAMLRVVCGGILAMAITYAVGALFGVALM